MRRYGDTLVGGKFGVALRLGQSKWSFNPAIGFAGNLGEGSRSSFLADGDIAYNWTKGGYAGMGVSLWDFAHKDITTLSWLGTAGIPLWKNDTKKHQMDLSIEWRQFLTAAATRTRTTSSGAACAICSMATLAFRRIAEGGSAIHGPPPFACM